MKHNTGIRAALALALCLLLVASCLAPFSAQAQSSGEIRRQINDLKAQQEEIQEKIQGLNRQMADNYDDLQAMVEQKHSIDQQITLLHNQTDNINAQIAAYGVLIADQQEALDQAEARYQSLSLQNRERIRAMEEEGPLSYWAVLFKAHSFADLLDRLNMMEEIAASDNRRLQALNEAAQTVTQARNDLARERENLDATRQSLEDSQQALEEKRGEADTLLQELNARGQEYEEYLAQAAAEKDRLLSEIAEKEEEYDRAAYQEWLATSVPPTTSPTAPSEPGGSGSSNGGEWQVPLHSHYVITSPFGMRLHPTQGIYKMHNGVDMACPGMTPIYASRSGQVTLATYNQSAGNYVKINHGDGFCSVYMHMTYFIVSVGENVSAGQLIGYVGNTGDVTGYHLHFGILRDGQYVNPVDYLAL